MQTAKNQGYIIIALILVIIAFLYWNSSKSQIREKWEYKIEAVSDATFDTDINAIGNHGWELVFARRASTGTEGSSSYSYEMIFKRKLVNK